MTTFTTEDRENAVGVTINVEPIPFAGWVNTAPPHIVDSGASVMIKELTDEEIKEVWMNRPANTAEGVVGFARAILRKAQEK